MNRPDPVQHMMLWGTASSAVVLLLYFLARGLLTASDFDPIVYVIIGGGIFTGFTLGGMAGVIIGAVFKHEQEVLNMEKIHNRRNLVMGAVFLMVLIISRILIFMAVGFVAHPLALSLLGALIASFASHHYLLRMEAWFKQEKPKRKRIHEEVLDIDNEQNYFEDEAELEHHSKREKSAF